MKTGDEKFEKDLTWRASAERLSFDGLVCITRQTISIGTKLNLVRANCSYYMEECLPRKCAINRSVKSKNNDMKFIQIIRTQRCRTIARNFCGEWHRWCGVSSALGSQSYSVCRNRFFITAYQTLSHSQLLLHSIICRMRFCAAHKCRSISSNIKLLSRAYISQQAIRRCSQSSTFADGARRSGRQTGSDVKM